MHLGIAYYPEHWAEERWAEDYALMRRAGITRVRLGEFAWCRLEPREGVFTWDWLDRAIALAAAAGLEVILCTPTEAPPPWLSHGHPETRPGLPDGGSYSQGGRRHVEAANPTFLSYADRIVRVLGERYGHDRRVVGWQLDNEIGAHTHFVSSHPDHERRFREWLQQRYGTVAALNTAWGAVFWSGEFSSFDEVEVLTRPATGKSPSYVKDFRTFGAELWVDFLCRQRDLLRPLCPGQFITHNLAWYGEQVDLWRLRDELDVIGIDAYQDRAEVVSAIGDLYAAVAGDKPWAVMETGGNLRVYRDATIAGRGRGSLATRLVRYALAGADTVSLFRFQTSPSGQEQWGTGNLRDAWGRPDERVVADCRRARALTDRLAPVAARPLTHDVAIVWDTDTLIWSEMWPIEGRRRVGAIDHPREVFELHHQLARRGHRPTFVSLEADLERVPVLVCWNLLLADQAQAAILRRYVEGGGHLLAGGLLGHLTRAGRRHAEPVPLGLTEVFGCTVRDMIGGAPGQAPYLEVAGRRVTPPDACYPLEVLPGGEPLATFAGWQESHAAAVVAKGRAVYVGLLCDRECWDLLLPAILPRLGLEERQVVAAHPAVESLPCGDGWQVVNNHHEAVTVRVAGAWRDLVADRAVSGTLALEPFGLAVLAPPEG